MRQIILLLFLFFIKLVGFSQAPTGLSLSNIEKLKESGEELNLETDRQFYCIDEKIFFTLDYKFKHPIDDVQWSNVVYVELIRWNGEKISQAKCKLNNNIASGYLTIPRTVLSGTYYMRAYTRWMRNFPVENYSYDIIKVINPFDSNIDQGPVQNNGNKLLHSVAVKGHSSSGIECITDKSIYKQREKVELTLQLKNPDTKFSNFCVSVAKAADIDTNSRSIQIADEVLADKNSIIFLPEVRGISISGKILNTDTTLSIANATLHLSTPLNWKYFTAYQTNDKGLFYFTLPDYYGQYDFYIDAVLENGESADILVDNDYCNRSIHLYYIPFFLDSIEKITALEMTVNMQISKLYEEMNGLDTAKSKESAFFGKPNHIYFTEEYIQLPNLEEFLYELVKEVRTIRTKKGAKLKLAAYSQNQNSGPLILLDNIPVLDVDQFLKIPLESIEKIEIIDESYIVTGSKYSGVICVTTKRKDFAGIKLNNNSRFFAYNLLSDGNFNIPDYSTANTVKSTYRQNLLYWDPDIKLNQNQPRTLSFYTSDSKGEYIIYIRSINDKTRHQLYGSCKIVVE